MWKEARWENRGPLVPLCPVRQHGFGAPPSEPLLLRKMEAAPRRGWLPAEASVQEPACGCCSPCGLCELAHPAHHPSWRRMAKVLPVLGASSRKAGQGEGRAAHLRVAGGRGRSVRPWAQLQAPDPQANFRPTLTRSLAGSLVHIRARCISGRR